MIEIKYYGGEMLIDPQGYFNSTNATIWKFRKLVKLSSASDLIYGTKAIESWIMAVEIEIVVAYNSLQRISKLKIENKFSGSPSDLKKLESRKRKFEKFKAILSESAVSHAGRR